jgi:hypothetical protein
MLSTQVIDDHKLLLKTKYEQAKALGEAVNASKARISEAKANIGLWRAQLAAACEHACADRPCGLAHTWREPTTQQCAASVERGMQSSRLAEWLLWPK